MEYIIKVDYVSGVVGQNMEDSFEFPGQDPIDACNFKIREILKKNDKGINEQGLIGVKIYHYDKKLLEVNYRKNTLELSDKVIVGFWIKH